MVSAGPFRFPFSFPLSGSARRTPGGPAAPREGSERRPVGGSRAPPTGTATGQPTFVHCLQPLVSKVSPLLTVTRDGPSGVPLAMMLPTSPLESLARAQ